MNHDTTEYCLEVLHALPKPLSNVYPNQKTARGIRVVDHVEVYFSHAQVSDAQQHVLRTT
jgi:hypothetical protein